MDTGRTEKENVKLRRQRFVTFNIYIIFLEQSNKAKKMD